MRTDRIDEELEVPADACVRPSRVRVTGRWNAPRLATADVRRALGLKRLAARLRRLGPKDREDCRCCGAAAVTVSDYGLFQLLFRSRDPVCQRFLDWVLGTVVPGLRARHLSSPPPPVTGSGGRGGRGGGRPV